MTLPQALTDSVSPETAVSVLLAVTGLTLTIAVLLCLFAMGQHRVIRSLAIRNERQAAHIDRFAEANAHRAAMQRIPPPRPPMARPVPAQTQQLPRQSDHGSAT